MERSHKFYWQETGTLKLSGAIRICGNYNLIDAHHLYKPEMQHDREVLDNDAEAESGLRIDICPGLYSVFRKYLEENPDDARLRGTYIAAVRLVHLDTLYNNENDNQLRDKWLRNEHFPEKIGQKWTDSGHFVVFSDDGKAQHHDISLDDAATRHYDISDDGSLEYDADRCQTFNLLTIKSRALCFRSAFGDGKVDVYGVKDKNGTLCGIEIVRIDQDEYEEYV